MLKQHPTAYQVTYVIENKEVMYIHLLFIYPHRVLNYFVIGNPRAESSQKPYLYKIQRIDVYKK